MINRDFKSILELVKAFPDEQTCIDHLETLRWNGNVVSPFDAASKVYKCAGNKYRCANTKKYFNVKTQTLFDNTKIPLQKWFMAIYLITGHKKGISSLQLGRDLNITQKSAWFLLHRIRACYGIKADKEGDLMGGGGQVVEVDETYVGGKVKNMSNKKRAEIAEKKAAGEETDNKIPVMGYLERGGHLRMTAKRRDLGIPDHVAGNVAADTALMTDTHSSYAAVGRGFAFHGVVNHTASEYVKDKVTHINTLEGAFSLFDRMVIGIYHNISEKHIQAYLDEHTFRYNSRRHTDCTRFNMMLRNLGNRLTYQALIAK